jgi:hypothetical protein
MKIMTNKLFFSGILVLLLVLISVLTSCEESCGNCEQTIASDGHSGTAVCSMGDCIVLQALNDGRTGTFNCNCD